MGRIPTEWKIGNRVARMKLDIRDATEAWIVMRRADPPEEPTSDGLARYHIQGIAVGTDEQTAEEIAVAMCRDETYLIGPMPVNVSLPHNRIEWPGLYFPLKETDVSAPPLIS